MNNTRNWKHLQSCLVKSDDCKNLYKKYKVQFLTCINFSFISHHLVLIFFPLTKDLSLHLSDADSQAIQIGKANPYRGWLLSTTIWVGVILPFFIFVSFCSLVSFLPITLLGFFLLSRGKSKCFLLYLCMHNYFIIWSLIMLFKYVFVSQLLDKIWTTKMYWDTSYIFWSNGWETNRYLRTFLKIFTRE